MITNNFVEVAVACSEVNSCFLCFLSREDDGMDSCILSANS